MPGLVQKHMELESNGEFTMTIKRNMIFSGSDTPTVFRMNRAM